MARKKKAKIEKESANEQAPVRVAILTTYLTDTMEDLKQWCDRVRDTTEGAEKLMKWQMEKAGFNPQNFAGVKVLNSAKGRTVFLETPEDHTLDKPEFADFAVAGCTESKEHIVNYQLRGSGLIVGRYSMFYGGRSKYSGNTAGESGYALDIPKKVETVKALLTDDASLEALLARDESGIRKALSGLNKRLDEPIIVTPFLSEALKVDPKEYLKSTIAKYNVLCVTKRFSSDEIERYAGAPILWHVPTSGEAVVTARKGSKEILAKGNGVMFQGEVSPLLYTRPGLDGTALTLAIERRDGPYNVLELYTDTPVEKGICKEKIREIAERTIARRRGY